MFRTRIRTALTGVALVLGILAVVLLPRLASETLLAQATLTSTTLSAAVTTATGSPSTVTVASATGVSAGRILFVDKEAMLVLPSYVSGTLVPVQRGYNGTAAQAHASGSTIYVGPASYYSQAEPYGPCTSSAEVALPRIVLPVGKIFNCVNGYWQVYGGQVGQIQASFVQGATPADALDTVFFLADREYIVTAVSAVWSTAESTGSMDIMVEKLTGTTACASGTDVLSAAIAATGTANTVNAGSLSATASTHLLAAGNRLCVDLTATPNEVANMVVTVSLIPR